MLHFRKGTGEFQGWCECQILEREWSMWGLLNVGNGECPILLRGVVNVVLVNVTGGECQGLKSICKNKQHRYFQKILQNKNGQGATKPKHKSERCIMNAYIHLH